MLAPCPKRVPAPQRANFEHNRGRQAFTPIPSVFQRRHRTGAKPPGTRKPFAPSRLVGLAAQSPATEHAEKHGGEAEHQAVPHRVAA